MARGQGFGTVAMVATVLLTTAGCDTTLPVTGPSTAPSVETTVPADEAYALAELEPPPDARTVSSVQRPNDGGVASYLVVQTTTPETALAFCSQLGGMGPLLGQPLSDAQRSTFHLTEDPPGELGVCGNMTKGERYGVQRDVLVAVTDDTGTVWVSAFEMLR